MALILLAALQTIPDELYEAAEVDGASAWQRFRYITLPHLLPTILFLVLLRTIWMSNHIDMIFVMTRGGPGFSNYTEAVYSFMLTNQFEIGYASAVAVVLAILLMAAVGAVRAAPRAHGAGVTRGASRTGVRVGGARSSPISLAPFLWIFIASITPELKADPATSWMSMPHRRVFPARADAPELRRPVRERAVRHLLPQQHDHRDRQHAADARRGQPRRVRFVRFRFPGRTPLLVAMLVAYTIPSVVLLVPLLVIFRTYGLINTHPGMILAEATHTAPFVLLLLINYFSTLPRELEEAAQVDGCGRLRTLVRIVLPLSVPGLVAAGLLAFIMTWNNFLFAFLFTTTDRVKTLPVMMRLFALGEPAVWGVSAAGAVLTTLPVALIFLLFQRMLMSGLAAGAVKG